MTPIEIKCEILCELYMDYSDDPRYSDFLQVHDIGIPCAYLLVTDKAILTDSGRESVEQTWQALCDLLEIDSNGEYEDLYDMFVGGA